LPPPSPPPKKATARQAQARKSGLTMGPGTATGTKTIYPVRNQQCRLNELHKFCSVFHFLGDTVGPTSTSEGSLGPRGRCVFPWGGPLKPVQPMSAFGGAKACAERSQLSRSKVPSGFPGGICHKAAGGLPSCSSVQTRPVAGTLVTEGKRRWTC